VDVQLGLVKRVEDIILCSMLILFLAPVLVLAALAVKLSSPGPALFRQERYGFNNEIFNVYKFRSMYHNPNVTVVAQASRRDPRVTAVGRFLRRSSIDELPQLFNVLEGSMSLVGPRPHAVPHNVEYGRIIAGYNARHNVKPGITGWAQVNGHRGETDTAEKMRQRVECDLYYIEHWSLFFDFKVMILTAVKIWFQKSAY
jgi:putative colanic acid biosynthesis UDP-glucose lipid carrier transferase